MKICLVFFCLLFSAHAMAQNADSKFRAYVDSTENVRRHFWDTKEYSKAIDGMKGTYSVYLRQDSAVQRSFTWVAYNLLYNTSCAFSLLNQCDSAVAYLQEAIKRGFTNYAGTVRDSDFDNIRNDERFKKVLAELRELGDYEIILRKNPDYESKSQGTPVFTYQNADELTALRVKYNLDSVAGKGDEISRIINLMRWAHRVVKHDGNSLNPADKRADGLITVCRQENRGVNCRMMATILNEAYLAEGLASKFVTCMPKGENFDDCHVINIVYSKQLQKWIWMDPTFEAYVTDSKDNLLSIEEVRAGLIRGDKMTVAASLNWNGKPYEGGANQYLHVYMAKNLFRFSCPIKSVSGFESQLGNRKYVDLYPVGYNPTNVAIGAERAGQSMSTFTTTNANEFWAKPQLVH
jgi:hypothetical protein